MIHFRDYWTYLKCEPLILGEEGGVVFSRGFSDVSETDDVWAVAAGGEPGKRRTLALRGVEASSKSTEDEVTSPLPRRTSVTNGINAWQDSSSLLKKDSCITPYSTYVTRDIPIFFIGNHGFCNREIDGALSLRKIPLDSIRSLLNISLFPLINDFFPRFRSKRGPINGIDRGEIFCYATHTRYSKNRYKR